MNALVSELLPDRAELSPARRRLFETALVLFSRDGYHGVSVRDIVAELDQAPTAIYAHVSSKQELLFALIRIAHEELRDQVRLALLEAGSDPAEQLRAIVVANVLTHLRLPELAKVSHSEHRFLSAEQSALIEVLRVDLGSLLRDVVNRGVEQGVFAPPDALIAYYAIAGMGVRAVDWWTPVLGLDPEHVATTQADLAMRMLAPART